MEMTTPNGQCGLAPAPQARDLSPEDKKDMKKYNSPASPVNTARVDPAVEKRLVRKLDLRLVPLVTSFCRFPPNYVSIEETNMRRRPRFPRQIQYRQCQNRRHVDGSEPHLIALYVAPNDLLHILYRFRTSRTHVENRPTSHVGRLRRMLMGRACDMPGRRVQLGRRYGG